MVNVYINISLLDNRNKFYIVAPSHVLIQRSNPFGLILFMLLSLFLFTLACFDLSYSSLFAVLGTIRSAVGSAQLLMSQKFEQFRGLCNENLVSVSVTSY